MPKAILNMLSECSPEGFLLFYIDNNGDPQVKAEFPHRITELGLRAHATKILDNISVVEDDEMRQNILRGSQEEEEGEI